MASNLQVNLVGSFIDRISGPLNSIRSGMSSILKIGVASYITNQLAEAGMAAIKVGADFETMQANLETAMGSAEAAADSMAYLIEINKKIPGSLADTTKAFIQLKNLGITPTEETMLSFANIAAGSNKPLTQVAEAAADAITGEFERLKEFGIKTKTVGDNLQFTFRNVTTTVKKNSTDIQQYLIDMGNTKFAGAIEKQMNTVNGKFSNLKDEGNLLLKEIFDTPGASNGLKDLIDTGIQLLKKMRENWAGFFKYLSETFGGVFGYVWDLVKDAFDGVKTLITDVLNLFGEGTSDSIAAWLTDWQHAIADVLAFFMSMITGIKNGFSLLKGAFLFAINAVIISVDDLVFKLSSKFDILTTKIKLMFEKVVSSVDYVFVTAGNIIIKGINAITSLWISNINAIIGVVNKIPGVKIDLIPEDLFNVPELKTRGDQYTNELQAQLDKQEKAYKDSMKARADIRDQTFGDVIGKTKGNIDKNNQSMVEAQDKLIAGANTQIGLSEKQRKIDEKRAKEAKERIKTSLDGEKDSNAELSKRNELNEKERKDAKDFAKWWKDFKNEQDADLEKQNAETLKNLDQEVNDRIKQDKEDADKQDEQDFQDRVDRLNEYKYMFSDAFNVMFSGILDGSRNAFQAMVDNFRDSVNAMVAQALAAKLTETLFGNGITMGGNKGSRAVTGLLDGLSGRANGGYVQAHTPYIVGERRPEIIVPDVNSKVIPNTDSLGGSTTVNVNINAIDRKSFTDNIEKFKFEISNAISDVNRYKRTV